MGFFDTLLGTNAGYTADMKALSREQLKMIVSQARVNTLDGDEEDAVEQAIDTARLNGKISLRKIDVVLRSLVSSNTISINDKKGLMTQFVRYFESQ